MLIGLTGSIAAGKSAVSDFLRQQGAHIIDADALSRQAVLPGSQGAASIKEAFGGQFFDEQGELKRRALGDYIFANPQKRELLNSLLHPLIAQSALQQYREIQQKDPRTLVILDAPLLIEAGWHEWCQQVWVVIAPEEVRLERLMKRDNMSLAQAQRRLSSQMPQQEKLKYADAVIDNGGALENTYQQVLKLLSAYRKQ
jgi:dephospho-CoA kinase